MNRLTQVSVIALVLIGVAATLVDGSLQAYCCFGARKGGPACLGDGLYRLMFSQATPISATLCRTDTSDHYGVVQGCVNFYVDAACY